MAQTSWHNNVSCTTTPFLRKIAVWQRSQPNNIKFSVLSFSLPLQKLKKKEGSPAANIDSCHVSQHTIVFDMLTVSERSSLLSLHSGGIPSVRKGHLHKDLLVSLWVHSSDGELCSSEAQLDHKLVCGWILYCFGICDLQHHACLLKHTSFLCVSWVHSLSAEHLEGDIGLLLGSCREEVNWLCIIHITLHEREACFGRCCVACELWHMWRLRTLQKF